MYTSYLSMPVSTSNDEASPSEELQTGLGREMEFMVIGAGLSRTGTLSTRVALEHLLEGPCYHGFVPVGERLNHIPLWMDVFQSGRLEPEMARRLLKDYRAGLDVTIFTWYKELMELHPSAKVVITVRDPHKWYTSMKNMQTMHRTIILTQPYAAVMRMIGLGKVMDFCCLLLSEKSPRLLGRVNRAMVAGEGEAVGLYEAHVEEVRHCITWCL